MLMDGGGRKKMMNEESEGARLAPDSAKTMEREAWLEGVGRVILANFCLSGQARLESSVAVSHPDT